MFAEVTELLYNNKIEKEQGVKYETATVALLLLMFTYDVQECVLDFYRSRDSKILQ